MRIVFAIAFLLTAAPAFSASLGLEGHFGRNGSCGVPSGNYPQTDDWTLLSGNELRMHEISCSFAWVAEDRVLSVTTDGEERIWSAIAQCYVEDEATSKLLTIQQRGSVMTVSGLPFVDEPQTLEQCD